MSSLSWLPLILILANLSAFSTAQSYEYCSKNGNYTTNSTYSTNLNALLSSLSSNMDNTGFYNASRGQNPDQANAIALCRADIQLDACRECVRNATLELVNSCPKQKQAILWSENCTLRYSNESIVGNRTDRPALIIHSLLKVSSPQQFNENLRTLVDGLRGQAASGGSLLKVAAGNRTAPDSQMIYAMLQCTPDISADDCEGCLIEADRIVSLCCGDASGVRVLAPSCSLRYENESFFNITRIREARAMVSAPVPVPAPAPMPVPVIPSPPPGNGVYNTIPAGKILVMVSIVVCLMLPA